MFDDLDDEVGPTCVVCGDYFRCRHEEALTSYVFYKNIPSEPKKSNDSDTASSKTTTAGNRADNSKSNNSDNSTNNNNNTSSNTSNGSAGTSRTTNKPSDSRIRGFRSSGTSSTSKCE